MTHSLLTAFEETPPFDTGFLEVGHGHRLYYSRFGNPEGIPVVYVHGGPGGHSKPKQAHFFDPQRFQIILYDQRGCGQSTPSGCLEHNTTAHAVADMEALRQHCGVDQWVVFGGSWGSTLGMQYIVHYPQYVRHAVLWGIYLGSEEEGHALFGARGAAALAWPDAHNVMLTFLSEEERKDPYRALIELLNDPSDLRHEQAQWHWCRWQSHVYLRGNVSSQDIENYLQEFSASGAMAISARMEAHYFAQNCFINADDTVRALEGLGHISVDLVHGRGDLICPAMTAWRVHKAWPNSRMHFLDHEGHDNDTPVFTDALMRCIENII